MEISVRRRSGMTLVIKSDNVHIEEDIEERIYSKTEDNKTDWSKPPERDVNTKILDQFSNVMEDLIYYRVKEYDSSSLIEILFEKLPYESIKNILSKLKAYYDE